MFSQPTRALAQALTTVSRMSEWREVDKLLADELTETTKRLMRAQDGVQARWLQGRAQLLVELRERVAQAPQDLATLKA